MIQPSNGASRVCILVLLAACAAALPALAAGGPQGPSDNQCLMQLVDRLPWEPLSVAEESAILFMRQEEKLARDVYLEMDSFWGARIFSNIAVSEQQHMDAVKKLVTKYGLEDSVQPDLPGEFQDPGLQELFTRLVASGSESYIEALIVGATIEDLDIADLTARLAEADNADVRTVFQNLLKGSRNHLRSFNELLEGNGIEYVPQYIDAGLFEEIVSSPHESGTVDENGDPAPDCGRKPGKGKNQGLQSSQRGRSF